MENLSSPTVLYVDDDPTQMEMYGVLLTSGGFTVVPVDVGVSPIEGTAAEGVDLILMDAQQQRPEDRVQIARLLRERYSDVPILLIADDWTQEPDAIQESVTNVLKCDLFSLVATIWDRVTLRSQSRAETESVVPPQDNEML